MEILNKIIQITLIYISLSSAILLNKCSYDIDTFNCINVNCNGNKGLLSVPNSLEQMINHDVKSNELLCSMDLIDTGITKISPETINNLNRIISNLIASNPEQESTTLKVSFSKIKQINQVNLASVNLAFFIYDSNVSFVQKNCFSNLKLELNLISVSLNVNNWKNLLNATNLKLLNLRRIESLKPTSYNDQRMSWIGDVKIYDSYIPILDDHFLILSLIDSIEQLELVNCSISFIKNSFFTNFRHLKYLTLSSNNINKVNDHLFNGIENVELLDLDDNPIEFIHPNAFSSLRNLKTLSINSHSLKFSTQMFQWLLNLIKSNNKLIDISLKSNRYLRNFCLLNQIVQFINDLNDYLFLKYENSISSDEDYLLESTHNERRIKLFTQDEIIFDLDRLSLDKNLYCSVFYVCKYVKNYTNSYFNAWSIEYFDICSNILSVHDNNEFICKLKEKIQECKRVSNQSGSKTMQQISERLKNNFLDSQFNIKTFFVKFNFVILFISFILTVIFISLIVFLIFSFIRKKFLFKEKNARRKISKNQSLQSRMDWYNQSIDSDYYVVLVNKKNMKI